MQQNAIQNLNNSSVGKEKSEFSDYDPILDPNNLPSGIFS